MFSEPEKVVPYLQLTDGMTVADFGAGSGTYALAAARRVGARGRVYAVEVQKDLLERLGAAARAAKLGNLEIIWGDVEKVGGSKLADGAVDRVIISNLLFEVDGKYTLALEAKRILRPDGLAAVVEWSDSFGGMGPVAERVIKPDEVKKIMAEAGFQFQNDFPAGDHHYGLLFKLKARLAVGQADS